MNESMNDRIFPEKKIFRNLESALSWRQEMKKNNKSVAVTNGCFDILHRGHAEYLLQARSLADSLLVLLNSDESVRALKGPSRPVNCEYDRAYLLASLSFVDAVLVFQGARCTRELDILAPDSYAKGGDYTLEKLDPEERTALLRHGTAISFIPFVPGHSTTLVLETARNS